MDIIPNTKNRPSIKIEDLTQEHIIVATDDDSNPMMFTLGEYEVESTSVFLVINKDLTIGNCYSYEKNLNQFLVNRKGWTFQAFHQDDWKEALQWLIENGK